VKLNRLWRVSGEEITLVFHASRRKKRKFSRRGERNYGTVAGLRIEERISVAVVEKKTRNACEIQGKTKKKKRNGNNPTPGKNPKKERKNPHQNKKKDTRTSASTRHQGGTLPPRKVELKG